MIRNLEIQIGNLEGKLSGLRQALSVIQKNPIPNGSRISKTRPVSQPVISPSRQAGGVAVRPMIREALKEVGEKFTPNDIYKALLSKNLKVSRGVIRHNLSRLKDNDEVFTIRKGHGGIEPIFSKTPPE